MVCLRCGASRPFWAVFLLFVVFKFLWALAHPDLHRDWEWVDYGIQENLRKLELTSFAPLRPRSSRERVKPLLCRVIAPDGSLWTSSRPSGGGMWASGPNTRSYPEDFKSPKTGQPPPRIPAGEYEITWLKPFWGPIGRPLVRYTQRMPEHGQETDSSERVS